MFHLREVWMKYFYEICLQGLYFHNELTWEVTNVSHIEFDWSVMYI